MAQKEPSTVKVEVTALRAALVRLGIDEPSIDGTIAGLGQASIDYHCRLDQAAQSPRIAKVVAQLAGLVELANNTAPGKEITLPPKLLRQVFDALAGRFPYSPLQLVWIPVGPPLDAIDDAPPENVRTATTGATVTPHVLHAAMRQWPHGQHFVTAKISSFPTAAAENYFFAELPQPALPHLRSRLETFIAGNPALAAAFFLQVATAVRNAASQGDSQNLGRRTLYRWSEPACAARLVADVCDAVLGDECVSVTRARAELREIVDILRWDIIWGDSPAGGEDNESRSRRHEDDLDDKILVGMLEVWRRRAEHRQILRRLDAMICQRRRSARSFPLTLALLENCRSQLSGSARELDRRANMGDPIGSRLGLARATGTPGRIIDVSPVLAAKTQLQLLRRAARACKS
jgi:hypothetical protein